MSTRLPPWATSAGLVLLFVVHTAVRADETSKSPEPVGTLLQRFCFDCHSGVSPEGGVNLKALVTGGAFARDFRAWRKVAD
ncbi:MAG TPA: hypothetical protein DCE39_01575, partial [Planctomycetaceae bacterium]|nr:hypothetical protein [Planctomycetaceae bacterium]